MRLMIIEHDSGYEGHLSFGYVSSEKVSTEQLRTEQKKKKKKKKKAEWSEATPTGEETPPTGDTSSILLSL